MRRLSFCSALSLIALSATSGTVAAQQHPAMSVDSALVGRILLAEDMRDSTNAALGEGTASGDRRIRLLATRAVARIRDAKFAAREAFPALAAPPKYSDPAWRLRFRALQTKKGDCFALSAALADSAWPVRLRAADQSGVECSGDSTLVRTLRKWAAAPPQNSFRGPGMASWQPAAHGLLALSRMVPNDARALLPQFANSPIPALRTYAARAAGTLDDTATLRRLAADSNDNVKEAAIDALARTAGHVGDAEFLAALGSRGYQAVRAAARALRGSPRRADAYAFSLAAAYRLRRDSSETSRDARLAVFDRLGEFASPVDAPAIVTLATDFDCVVAHAAAAIATRLKGAPVSPVCSPMPITLPPEAVALALGRSVRLRVTLADSSGGGSFIVRLRGDVAPITAGRILELARAGYYNGLTWHRVEPDFVIQGGGTGANEYVGNPRFFRDELGTVSHVRGTIGLSTRGHDTGDAQWFVNLRDNTRLDADYTLFGEVVEGMDVVDGVLEGDVIERIEVIGS